MVFMANQSSITHHKRFNHRPKDSNTATGSSKSLVDERNKSGSCFSEYEEPLALKNKVSSRILGSETNQDHKRRCLEQMVVRRDQQNVEDANCALEVEVIDDTALIEVTAAVKRFKNRYRKETDLGFGKSLGKEENGGKKKRNKGFKKQGNRCSTKCVNEKKLEDQVVEDKNTSGKKILEGKGQKGCGKMSAKVKYVYRKKDTKNPKSVVTGVEDQSVVEKIVGDGIEESDVSLKFSVGDEKESTIKKVETDASLKVSVGDENESTVKLVETDASLKVAVGDENESTIKVIETDESLKVSVGDEKESTILIETAAVNDVVIHTEAEDENVSVSANVGSKKTAYTRAEMEALRFVDEPGQTAKWIEVYSGFAPSVVNEYTGLVCNVSNGPQRYRRVVNCGYVRHANPILSMPPGLPLCSPSNHRKVDGEGV